MLVRALRRPRVSVTAWAPARAPPPGAAARRHASSPPTADASLPPPAPGPTATARARRAGVYLAGGCLFAFAGTFAGIAWDRARRRRDLALVAAMPILPGNPLVFLDIADREVPVGRVVVHVRADAAPRAAATFVALATAPLGHGYRSSPLHGLDKGARVFGGDWFGGGAGSFDPATGRAGGIPSDAGAAGALRHVGPGAVGLRPFASAGGGDDDGASAPPAAGAAATPASAPAAPAALSSQFYITLRALPHLDDEAAGVGRCGQLLGYVVEGWGVLEALDAAGRTDGRFRSNHDLRVAACGVLPPGEAQAVRARHAAAVVAAAAVGGGAV